MHLLETVSPSALAATARMLQSIVPDAKGAVLLSEAGAPLAANLPHGLDLAAVAKVALAKLRAAEVDAIAHGATQPASVFVDLPQGRILAVFMAS